MNRLSFFRSLWFTTLALLVPIWTPKKKQLAVKSFETQRIYDTELTKERGVEIAMAMMGFQQKLESLSCRDVELVSIDVTYVPDWELIENWTPGAPRPKFRQIAVTHCIRAAPENIPAGYTLVLSIGANLPPRTRILV